MGAGPSHQVDEDDTNLGDHIYTWRSFYLYAHHGIYVGENKVIHLTNPAGGSGLSSAPARAYVSCSLSYCGTKQAGNSVVMSCLKCFLEGGKKLLHRYGLMTQWEMFGNRRGTCTTARSDTPQEVIHRATYLLNHNVWEYNAAIRNCEDFALYCKTGLWNPLGIGHHNSLLHPDLGCRSDVYKVNVEDFPGK